MPALTTDVEHAIPRHEPRSIRLSAVILAGVLTYGCAGDSEPPVATPSVTFDRDNVALGSPLEATYRFSVAPTAPAFAEDYRVFVHFLDADEELMWAADHDPAVPTSQWKPGQTISYTRQMLLPVHPYIGEASVAIGLYSPTTPDRLPLAGEAPRPKSLQGGHAGAVAPIRERLPDLQGWLVSSGVRVAMDSAGSDDRLPKSEAGLPFLLAL